jgi:alpha-glucosidase
VQDAVLDVAHFWLKRGVDGFRLDTINLYFHDDLLRDNPALPPEERNATVAPSVNPFNYQQHLYSKNRPENIGFLRRLRAVMDQYGAAAVGEVGDAERGLEIMGEYTAGDDLMQMCYAFEFLCAEQPTAARIDEVLTKVDEVAADGWACWAFSNHDVKRHITRWQLSDAAARAMTTLIVCLRGSVCIYQGEELGLPEADVAFEDLQDPYGIEFWPEFKGRDGCRTPMVWENSNQNGGFSEAKPWLPVSDTHLESNVAAQTGDPAAILHHYKAAIALRHANPALSTGAHSQLTHEGDVLSFVRSLDGTDIFCAFNLSDDPATVTLPAGTWTQAGAGVGGASIDANTASLAPWQPLLAQRIS